MFDHLPAIVAAFLIAGVVKGVVGLGLPIVAVGLLTALVGLKEAMVLMLAPSLVANAWQALVGGHLLGLLQRLAPLLVVCAPGVWLGVGWLAASEARALTGLLGVVLALYALIGLARWRLPSPGRLEWAWSMLIGFVNGVLTGLTGSFAVPAIPYLQALGLDRHQLIQAMGVVFLVSTVLLALAMSREQLLTADLGIASLIGIVPTLAGMVVGQHVRHRLPEATFRRVFLVAILLLGLYIATSAFVQ